MSLAASEVSALSSISRSAPAMKSALADVTMMPFTFSSLNRIFSREAHIGSGKTDSFSAPPTLEASSGG